MGVGLGLIDGLSAVGNFIPVTAVYEPNPADKAVYDRNFSVFKTLYKTNNRSFALLNRI